MPDASPAALIAALPDATPLPSLTIPGTHDAATGRCDHPYYRTQTLTLAEQLDCGVRFFDIRLRRTMMAAHREWLSDISGEEIFSLFQNFLAEHPRDFILVRLQNANEAKDDFPEYGRALHGLISRFRDLLWVPPSGLTTLGEALPDGTPSAWPTLGEIRGKVVAFECAPNSFGISMIDGAPWAIPWHENPAIDLQDDWDGPDPETKFVQIRDFYAAHSDERRLVLNHVSATNGDLGEPHAYAERLNPRLPELVAGQAGRGIFITDFITPELARLIWAGHAQD